MKFFMNKVDKCEIKKEAVVKSSSDLVLKDMDQILPPQKGEKETKSIFKNDAKKQKTTPENIPINLPGTASATAKPVAGKSKKPVS